MESVFSRSRKKNKFRLRSTAIKFNKNFHQLNLNFCADSTSLGEPERRGVGGGQGGGGSRGGEGGGPAGGGGATQDRGRQEGEGHNGGCQARHQEDETGAMRDRTL